MRKPVRRAAAVALAATFAAGLVLAIAPEPAARPLVTREGWRSSGGAPVLLAEFPEHFRQVRRSVAASPDGLLYRSWNPERGVEPLEVVSPPFRAPRRLAVVVTGATRTRTGVNAVWLECSTSERRLPVFTGNVNVNAAEALLEVPPGFCSGEARLHLVSDGADNVGVGTPVAVSALSAWKASFLGLLPYGALALLVTAAIAVTGAAALARALRDPAPAVLTAGIAIGLAALLAFYLTTILPRGRTWIAPVVVAAAIVGLGRWGGRARLRAAAAELAPYGRAWTVAALAYLALLLAARNGLGHWEPNYRFWPAAWSSDNELPWMFAEALRSKIYIGGLFGSWHPTDRPPLLAGAHLLLSDLFALLQLANDGPYLRGLAYDAGAVVFNALWVPAALFLVRTALRLPARAAAAVLATAGLLPFAIFNTIYGWPKAFGAAFGLAAAALALRSPQADPRVATRDATLFGALSGLSLLSHGSGAFFLLPVAAWLFFRSLARRPRALLSGVAAGGLLLASWAVYQRLVFPSRGPVTRFALTGDFGFGSKKSLWTMIVQRYQTLGFTGWLEVKARMLVQPFLPISTSVWPVHLNDDTGAGALGLLRAWDAFLLSGGNLPVVVLGVAAFAVAARSRGGEAAAGGAPFDGAAARALAGFALASYALLVATFLAPLILHTWPQAAVLGAACAGLGWLAATAPRAFRATACAIAVYAAVVWGVSPLLAARDVDVPALVVFVALAGGVGWRLVAPATAHAEVT